MIMLLGSTSRRVPGGSALSVAPTFLTTASVLAHRRLLEFRS